MWHPKLAAPFLAGALLLGGVAACGEDEQGGLDVEDQEITPGVDPGEEPVIDEDEGLVEEEAE